MIRRLAIIGLGLIGGSLSLALKRAGVVSEVVGYARQAQTRERALELGLIDVIAPDLASVVHDADVVFLAVPMGAMAATFTAIAPHLKADAVITDGGSAKAPVVEAAQQALGDAFVRFVPGHPIAGTEKSGPDAAFADLYREHRVILTPTAQTDPQAVAKIAAMWRQTGAEVVEMNVKQHDTVLAATSHLPHVLAFNLVAMLATRADVAEVLQFAAGGFRDFSRIASSDPVMWRDICLANQQAILELLERYQHDLDRIASAIRDGDGDYLLTAFDRAKRARDHRFAEPKLYPEHGEP